MVTKNALAAAVLPSLDDDASAQLTAMMRRVEAMEAEQARLSAENAALKAGQQPGSRISFKVAWKGGVSIYGMGRFPVTLYFENLVAFAGDATKGVAFDALTFAKTHEALLNKRDDSDDVKAAKLKLRIKHGCTEPKGKAE